MMPGVPHMGAGARLGERTKYPFYHIVLEIVIQIQQIDCLNGFPDEHQLTFFRYVPRHHLDRTTDGSRGVEGFNQRIREV